jgi:undecaprenyl-diphosphatase
MFAATAKKMLDYYLDGNLSFGNHEIVLLIIGNVVAFIVAMIAIKSFIGFLTKHGFLVFGYYRIIAGLVILLMLFLGIEIKI